MMKKKILLALFANCSLNIFNCELCAGFVQNPMIKKWDRRMGGINSDATTAFIQTSDGGYIVGGWSGSLISGDKTQPSWGGLDHWIVKLDSLGNPLWDKDYGGTHIDYLFALEETSDKGLILGGFSRSGINGDKTQANWDTSGNTYDIWLIKTDSMGVIEWDKSFGGPQDDLLYSLNQTRDNGYILGSYSYSDATGDKTDVNRDPSLVTCDYWIIKIDSVGNKEWDKTFGGDDDDILRDIQQTPDGGYILGGTSWSGVSGDKTEPLWGVSDYWLVKVDSAGTKQWDKVFGGTLWELFFSLELAENNCYIFGGSSWSGVSGDRSQPSYGNGDYWIIKVDSAGNKIWDKAYGGSGDDELCDILQLPDKGFLISGDSYSPISGVKSESNIGQEQSWIIKIDSAGTLKWDKTIFTPGHDENAKAILTKDNCYAISNFCFLGSGIGGYKSQASWSNLPDYWIVKLCDSMPPPQSDFFTDENITCPGSCISFVNFSQSATSFLWSFPGGSPSTSSVANPQNICYNIPGVYDVQLIAYNLNSCDTLLLAGYIVVYPQTPQSISQSGDTLFANSGATSYQWYFNGNIISGATDYFYVAPSGGDYNVVATDGNGCEVEAVMFNVVAGLQSTVDGRQLMIFPNPVGDEVKIQKLEVKSETALEIAIYNVIGERVLTVLPPLNENDEQIIDVSILQSGMYWIEIMSGEKVFRAKFIKE